MIPAPAHPVSDPGTRFRVRSRSGTEYGCVLLHRAPETGGLVVRLDDQRLARLDPERIDWATLELQGTGETTRAGDDVTVVLAGSQTQLRGTLLAPVGQGEVALRNASGREQRLPLATVREVLLGFRARDLQAGDRFVVRSRSGNYYRGRVAAVAADGTIQAALEGGSRVTIQWARLDPDSLLVLVPVQLDALRGG